MPRTTQIPSITAPIDPLALEAALIQERSELHEAIERRVAALAEDPGDEVAAAALELHRAELDRVEAALARHDRGVWDVCEACGGAVGDERLQVLPTATTCEPCAQHTIVLPA